MTPILTFDHSQRSSRDMCRRMHLLRYICGLRKASPEGAGFAFGTAFHASTEVIDITDDVSVAMETFASLFNFPDDKVRTLLRAKTMLEQYQLYKKQQGWKFVQQENEMEVAFNKPLTDQINFAGKCDRKLEDGSIGEFKTTYYLYNSSGNPMPYLQQWWGHNSIRGYAWATDANKVVLLGAGVYPQKEGRGGKEYPCIAHLTIPIQPWEIEQFILETSIIGNEIIRDAEQHNLRLDNEPESFPENLENVLENQLFRFFPTSTSRCYFNINNPCQFLDLCTRNIPKGLVEGNYVIDPFLPWKETTEEA